MPLHLRLAGLVCLCLLLVSPLRAEGLQLHLQPEDAALHANILAHLGEMQPRNTQQMQRFVPYARRQVASALEALGYYTYELAMAVIPGDPATLDIQLELGEPVRLRQVNLLLTGAAGQDADFAWPALHNLQPGQVLNHAQYEAVKRHWQRQAQLLGYFEGQYTRQELVVDPQAGYADVYLQFDSGPRYRFGAVTFEQDGQLDDALLQGFVPFEEGMPYDSDLLVRLSQNLRASSYFQEVQVHADTSVASVDTLVPVTVRVTSRPAKTLNLGLGYSTDMGPRISSNWTHYRVNNQGHSRGLDTLVSEPIQSFSTWYQWPLDPPMTNRLRWSAQLQHEYSDIQDSLLYGTGIQWYHRYANDWDRIVSLSTQREHFVLGEQDERVWLTMPGLGFARLYKDRDLDPANGLRLQVDVRGGKEGFLSDLDVLQVTLLTRGLVTLGDRHRFLARVQAGVLATNDAARVPASLRFFAGGDQSVRGYGYQELAPRDESGDVLGGRYLLATGVEYQFALSDRWRLAVFADAGNAADEAEDLAPMYRGQGIGLRWVSPVGPLRLDLARGDDDALGGWRIHFSMGPDL